MPFRGRKDLFQANERLAGFAWKYAKDSVIKELDEAYRTKHFVASNMTCSLEAPWYIDGKRVHWINCLGRANGMPSISLVSLYDQVRLAAMADT